MGVYYFIYYFTIFHIISFIGCLPAKVRVVSPQPAAFLFHHLHDRALALNTLQSGVSAGALLPAQGLISFNKQMHLIEQRRQFPDLINDCNAI